MAIQAQKKSGFFFQVRSTLLFLGFLVGSWNFNISKIQAAEDIFLNYGPLQFSLSVEALRTYAEEGEITGDLRDYARFLSEEQLKSLRAALVKKVDIQPLSVAQFFYSYQGVKILERVGQIVQTKAGQSGFFAIRSALILAANSEEGLTPLNFLETFPITGITIDSVQGFQIIDELSVILQETNLAIAAVEEQAFIEKVRDEEIFAEGINSAGKIDYRIETFSLEDRQRRRVFPVDLYLPKRKNRQPLSLVVISHGLGSDRTSFDYLAKFLASYGFAVAVPEHPGSNADQIKNLLEGFANDVTPPTEFINRPLDISHLLDYLETNYQQQINLNSVGIIGQSFGAYTALALAGAELNFETLDNTCQNLDKSFNVSLFLQCLALELPRKGTITNFRDPRITSAIAINPLTSAIFGEKSISQIKIPTMIVSGSADPVTPALPEQIKPFAWLNNKEKYFVLFKGGTHFSTLNESGGSIPVPAKALGPDPKIAQGYLKQLSLLFFSEPRNDKSDIYASLQTPSFGCLCSSYATSITQPLMPLRLIKGLSEESLGLTGSNYSKSN